MKLGEHLFKASRWGLSSLFGRRGRNIADKYGPALTSCLEFLIPTLNLDDRQLAKAEIENWAKDRGVLLEDLDAFVKTVREKAGKK